MKFYGGVLLCVVTLGGCYANPDGEEIDVGAVTESLAGEPTDSTGTVMRAEVGVVDLDEEALRTAEPLVPPYDMRGQETENAREILRASLEAQRYAKDQGLEAGAMLADANGRLFVDLIDPSLLEHAELGIAPSSDDVAGDGDFVPKGWSHNTDNRWFLGTGSWFASDTHSAYSRIGQLGNSTLGNCTGTLFGRRLVLTAAHCVVGPSGWITSSFSPRRRGSTNPYGSSSQSGTTWFTAYTANNCHTNFTNSCVKYDLAIMILPPTPTFTSHPGWMGFAYASDATTASWNQSNVGYPGCAAGTMAPAGCQTSEPYGDILSGGCSGVAPVFQEGSSANSWPFGSGANPVMNTGCDISPGHSGGPVYSYSPGSNGPYILGNSQRNSCWLASCTPSQPYSARGVRINSTLYSWMLSLRSSYP